MESTCRFFSLLRPLSLFFFSEASLVLEAILRLIMSVETPAADFSSRSNRLRKWRVCNGCAHCAGSALQEQTAQPPKIYTRMNTCRCF